MSHRFRRRDGVITATPERMATKDSTEAKNASPNNTVALYGLDGVRAACGIKTTAVGP